MDEITFTGTQDADQLILNQLDDVELFATCGVNKYTQSLCDYYFWRLRFESKYGFESKRVKNIAQLYYTLSMLSPSLALKYIVENGYVEIYKKLTHSDTKYSHAALMIQESLEEIAIRNKDYEMLRSRRDPLGRL